MIVTNVTDGWLLQLSSDTKKKKLVDAHLVCFRSGLLCKLHNGNHVKPYFVHQAVVTRPVSGVN